MLRYKNSPTTLMGPWLQACRQHELDPFRNAKQKSIEYEVATVKTKDDETSEIQT